MKTAGILCCLVFCLLIGVPQCRADNIISLCDSNPANLVANCGFETGDFTGWTLAGNDVPTQLGNLYGVEGVDPVDGISPNSGDYQAYFADLVADSITLSQTVATVAGGEYEVSWYMAQDTAPVSPYSNQFSASFGGVSLVSASVVPVQGYTYYSFEIDAPTSSSVLSLTMGNDLGEFLVDDLDVFAVVATPEPATWTLALAGILACMLGRRRMTRRAALR